MIPDANLLFYTNLAGEMFYIISHRMKSQSVKLELQQRVYNDLAICVCHPVVVQNLVKGKLQILEMNMMDIRTLIDRMVHSSIMTVNAYSMEKLFELTLIATRYQYTVCQHPKDVLLIALNHLDGMRSAITDPTAIQLCESLHKIFIDRLQGESSIRMQEYRFSILTYLADVKLKMTNLIKLGFQKSSGEFVKDFPPTKFYRDEFKQPGLIELYGGGDVELEHSDSSDTSDSNNEAPEDNYNIDEEEIDEEHCMRNQFDEKNDPLEGGDNGCHFENISLQIHDNELEEDDDLLEIEYVENSFQEILESSSAEPSIVMKFTRQRSETEDEEGTSGGETGVVPMCCSYELHGSRGITLGQSIYEIPGNSDEGAKPDVAKTNATSEPESEHACLESDLDAIAIKSVQGLELCSILLGCKNQSEVEYKSPLTNFRTSSSGEESSTTAQNLLPESYIPFTSSSHTSTSSNITPITGVNVVKFDARTDRSQSKATLSKISKELDFGSDWEPSTETEKSNLFDLLEPEPDV